MIIAVTVYDQKGTFSKMEVKKAPLFWRLHLREVHILFIRIVLISSSCFAVWFAAVIFCFAVVFYVYLLYRYTSVIQSLEPLARDAEYTFRAS